MMGEEGKYAHGSAAYLEVWHLPDRGPACQIGMVDCEDDADWVALDNGAGRYELRHQDGQVLREWAVTVPDCLMAAMAWATPPSLN